MKSGKIWGQTELIFKNDSFEIHRIFIKKGGYCSKHMHNEKYNMFYVEKGELCIEVYKNDYDLIDTTILKMGEKMSVSPREYHLFKTNVDTIAYEIYYNFVNPNDIIRENCGGVK